MNNQQIFQTIRHTTNLHLANIFDTCPKGNFSCNKRNLATLKNRFISKGPNDITRDIDGSRERGFES